MWHMEVPGLGVELELQLPAYATATATPDLTCICDLNRSLQQHQILNPWARPGFLTRWATMGTPMEFPCGMWVKDPSLSLQQLRSLLWLGFDPWPGNFHMPQEQQKKKKKKRIRGRVSNKYWHMNVHRGIILSSQKLKTTQMSIHCWQNKQIVTYPYNGI